MPYQNRNYSIQREINMKASFIAVITPIALSMGLSACNDIPQIDLSQADFSQGVDTAESTGSTSHPQTRSLKLRKAYNDFNLINPAKAGKSKSYTLRPKNPTKGGWKVKYEISNLGTSLNGKSIKIQTRQTLKDENGVIRDHTSSIRYYNAEDGALQRVSFSNSGVTGLAVQEGTLPSTVPLDGGEESGILNRVDYSNGVRSTGTWQWLGKVEDYYILYVTNQYSVGNEGREAIIAVKTFKYYITSDGQIPFFDMRVEIPSQNVDITFKATQSAGRSLPATEVDSNEANADSTEAVDQ